jgi:GNAT superfamily N-acetyltransferase
MMAGLIPQQNSLFGVTLELTWVYCIYETDKGGIMEVYIAQTQQELERAADIFLQLRPAFNVTSLCEQITQQQKQGYQVAYVELNGRVVCVAGFTVSLKLAWGKSMYIDDLVTDSKTRSVGAGKQMIEWLKMYAKNEGCREIHLDSGGQRYGAHRFYFREGFNITSHHFVLNNISE